MTVAMQPRSTPGMRPDLERGRRKNATGVAERNQRVGLAVADQFGGAADGAVAFFAERAGGFVVHLHDFAGVDDAHAMIAKTAQGRAAWMSAWLPTR